MDLQRVSHIDAGGYLAHEWFPGRHAADDRAKELHTLGMEGIDIDEVTIPWDNIGELIHWLNNNPNSPTMKGDTMDQHTPQPISWPTVPGADPSPLDVQEGGDHYKTLPIQPVEYIHANGLPFIEGNVVKYVTRHRAKGGISDLKKARHFIDLLIELEQRNAEG